MSNGRRLFFGTSKTFQLLYSEKVTDPHGNEIQPTCLFSVIVSRMNVFFKNLILAFMLLI